MCASLLPYISYFLLLQHLPDESRKKKKLFKRGVKMIILPIFAVKHIKCGIFALYPLNDHHTPTVVYETGGKKKRFTIFNKQMQYV